MSSHTPSHVIHATTERMARLGSLRSAERIALLGPGGADALCSLCRLGFEEAVCLGDGDGPCCHGDAPVSALLVPDRLTDLLLTERLHSGLRWLGATGAVILRLRDVDQDRVVQSALEQTGFTVRSTVFDLSRGALVAHRVTRFETLAHAA